MLSAGLAAKQLKDKKKKIKEIPRKRA